MPDDLQARLDLVRRRLRRGLLPAAGADDPGRAAATNAEWLEVASHLIQLTMVVKPESLTAKVMYARLRLRFGERDEAIKLLEQVREPKPEQFESGEDEEAWYQACQMLGDIYLEGGRPDLAVTCLTEFRKSAKSGARTLYKLGQAYEQLGDRAHAVKAYQMVTAYDGNPLVYDARSAPDSGCRRRDDGLARPSFAWIPLRDPRAGRRPAAALSSAPVRICVSS